jgi:dihydroorotase
VTTTALALAYRARILAALPEDLRGRFEPLMTLYLTDNTPPDEIKRARDAGIKALKLYPAGATTNSDAGVTDIRRVHATLDAMQREGLLLLVHGEVTDPDVDVFDREAVFIERVFEPLHADFPALRVVFEHITTREAVEYVASSDARVGATSRRTTCSTTATPSSRVACARTCTACRCSSARSTARRCSARPPQAAPSSFSAPTVRRIRPI